MPDVSTHSSDDSCYSLDFVPGPVVASKTKMSCGFVCHLSVLVGIFWGTLEKTTTQTVSSFFPFYYKFLFLLLLRKEGNPENRESFCLNQSGLLRGMTVFKFRSGFFFFFFIVVTNRHICFQWKFVLRRGVKPVPAD